jgi:DNA-binding transcriptional regulator YiaG
MSKEPVKRRPMFVRDGVKTEAKRMNAVMPSRAGEMQPELCHGSESIPRQTEEEKSQPRVLRDTKVDAASAEVDIANDVSVDDLRAKLKEIGLTQREFSRFSRTPYDTVRGWFRGTHRIPGMATTVLVMLSRDATLAATCRATGWEPLW